MYPASLTRWISYWTVGWQAFATTYSIEIGDLFAEMVLIRDAVRDKMPGNKSFIDEYLDTAWPIVIPLTDAVDRFDAPDPLLEKFREYIDAQEDTLRSRLDKIHYIVDSSDTVVQALIRGEPIERVC